MMDQNRHSEADSGSLPPHFQPPQSLPGWFPFSTFPSPYTWYRRIQPQFHCPAPPLLQDNTTSISSGFQKLTIWPETSQLPLSSSVPLSCTFSPSLSTLLLSLRLRLTGTSFSCLGSLYILRPITCVLHEAFPQHLCSQESLTTEFLLPQPNSCLQPLPYVCACVGAGCMRAGTSQCPPATAPPCTRCPTVAHSLT